MLETLMVPPLLFVSIIFLGFVIFAWRCKHERLVTFWCVFSLYIQGLLEFNYGLTHTSLRAAHTTGFLEYALKPVPASTFLTSAFYTDIYGQYAKYDYRYTNSDSTIISLTIAEIVDILGYAYLIWAIQAQHKWRHPFQLALNAKIAYATSLYFLVPFWDGSWYYQFFNRGPGLPTSDGFEFTVYVAILNGLWIIVPLAMCYQSWQYLGKALDTHFRLGATTATKKKN